MPFVRNGWYVAALPEEIDAGPLGRTVLDTPLVVFRQPGGAPAALLDICPHRFAALSNGQIKDSNEMEAALAAQMVAIHLLTMKVTARALKYDYDTRTAAAAGKLARTFTLQLEALQTLRGRKRTAHQSITVRKELHQHVHDHRGEDGNARQPHGPRATIVDQCATLPSPEPGGEALPLPGHEGQGAMPDALRR